MRILALLPWGPNQMSPEKRRWEGRVTFSDTLEKGQGCVARLDKVIVGRKTLDLWDANTGRIYRLG